MPALLPARTLLSGEMSVWEHAPETRRSRAARAPVSRRNQGELARMNKLKVLFLCTGNSCRSQMAEGWARHLKSDSIDAFSAGVEPHGLNPLAVKAMAEAGVDITGQRSKDVAELRFVPFDYIVTVCSSAHERCPVFFGGGKVVHVGFDDPPRLAQNARDEEEAMGHYRRVRDEIRAFVETLPQSLQGRATEPL